MTSVFPLNPQNNDTYLGYFWDGEFWKKQGIEITENYLEESSASATYLTQVNASTTYITQASASTIYQPKVENISDTEIGYLNNVSSNIQTQLNAKAIAGSDGVPFKMAAGSVYVGSNSPVSVTFPSSRFSVSPIVQVTGTSGWGWFSNLSSTGVVIYQTQSWGGASQAGTMHWTAVQMTSGAADG